MTRTASRRRPSVGVTWRILAHQPRPPGRAPALRRAARRGALVPRRPGMPEWNAVVLAGVVLVAVALAVWVFRARRKQRKAQEERLDRVGFRPCPDEKSTLEALANRVKSDRGHQYRVEQPRRLAAEPAVYYYVKLRDTQHA